MTDSQITSREDLIDALSKAAELEHGIICQYLFAAFSIKTDPSEGHVTWPQVEQMRDWKASLLLIARQEMEHLGVVSNLLSAVGGAPWFHCPPFPHAVPYCPPYSRFDLEGFSEAAMQRFACFEQLHGPVVDASASSQPFSPSSNTIGTLYQRIQDGIQSLTKQNYMLFIGPSEAQIGNQHLGLPPGHFDIDILMIKDPESAIAAIDHILEAGTSMPQRAHTSHAERFAQIIAELHHIKQIDPNFEPARPVVTNPTTQPSEAPEATMALVTHPETRQAMHLFNLAYETMLLMLMRFHAPVDDTPEEREGLMQTAFFPFMTAVLRPLGEILTLMPIEPGVSAKTAGPSFECRATLSLPPFQRSAWSFLHERLQTLARICKQLCLDLDHASEPWSQSVQPRLILLHENLEQMSINFESYMGLQQLHLKHLLKGLS